MTPDASLAAGYERFSRTSFFTSLDGLRAISILAVIWHHAAESAFPAATRLVHEGNRGVHLFFVISAFLISTLLLRARRRGALDVPRFWCRRALRILPLYYAVLLGYVGLVWFLERGPAGQAFFSNLPAFASFTSNWFVELDGRVIFYFAWSLAAEEQFYLCWPWVERGFGRALPAFIALGLLVVTQLAGLAYVGGAQTLPLKILSSVPAAILLGVILAHVLDSARGYQAVARFAGRRGSAWAAAAAVLIALWFQRDFGFFGELLVAVTLTFLVAACVVREDNDFARALRLRPVAWIGTISFGIYLLHVLCIRAVRGALASAHLDSVGLLFLGSTLLSVAIASVSYLTYERFFLRLKDRWFSDRRAAAPGPTPVAPAKAPAVATSLPG